MYEAHEFCFISARVRELVHGLVDWQDAVCRATEPRELWPDRDERCERDERDELEQRPPRREQRQIGRYPHSEARDGRGWERLVGQQGAQASRERREDEGWDGWLPRATIAKSRGATSQRRSERLSADEQAHAAADVGTGCGARSAPAKCGPMLMGAARRRPAAPWASRSHPVWRPRDSRFPTFLVS